MGRTLIPGAGAQSASSNLSGIVIDETKAVVAGAAITLIDTATGLQRETRTNESGYFIIPVLPPGTYTLTAEMPGFATLAINGISLQVSINKFIQIELELSQIAERLDVKASNGVLDGNRNRIADTTATVKHSITNEQVVSLPILTSTLGRNVLEVLPYIVPGVVPATQLGPARGEVNQRGGEMSVNGSRATSVGFSLEGGDNNDHEFNHAAAPLPNPDALQEFTVITNNYQADVGRSSGGVIDAAIKSGTSRHHGNGRYIFTNEAFNKKGFFDQQKPRDRLNTFGGQLGGPLRLPRFLGGKDRNFFFMDYEGTRAKLEETSNITVLSHQERMGDFRNLLPPFRPVDPATGQPFPDSIIPATSINPISRFYLDHFIPLPNLGERTFQQLLLTEFDNDQFIARVDHHQGDAGSLSLTYFYNLSDIDDGTETLPVGSKIVNHLENQNLILRETRTLSSRTVNQFTAALTRFIHNALPFSPEATGVEPSEVGFTGIRPQTREFLGLPALNILLTDVRVNSAIGSTTAKTVWQIKDDLSRSLGNHSLKIGAEVRGYLQNTAVGNNNGSFNFFDGRRISVFTPPDTTRTFFGTKIADFLLGIPSQYFQTSGNLKNARQRAFYFYVMDEARLRPNLTLNLGLRYELVPSLVDKLDQVSVFRPGHRSRRFSHAAEGILFVGDPDPILGTVPRSGYPSDKNNFAPRFGIAYSPAPEKGLLRLLAGNRKMALRAGAGLFYDQTLGFSFSRLSETQPFSVSQLLSSSQIEAAQGTFANPFGSLPNPWPLGRSTAIFTNFPSLQPFDPTFRTAYTYHYNLTLQRELSWSMLLEIGYVGNSSFKLHRQRELNNGLVFPDAERLGLQSRRIYPSLGSILSQESTGRARYDSLQLSLARRRVVPVRRAGLSFDLSYVFGNAFDDDSGPAVFALTDPLRWARAAFDRRHNFVASYTYSLPSTGFTGILGRVLNEWQVSGITQLRSGLPIDIGQTTDATLMGNRPFGRINPDQIGPFERLDPRETRTITVNGVQRTGNFLFDPNLFRLVPITDSEGARAGNLGRNVFDGPGINLWSFSIIKRFPTGEGKKISLRADIRNIFNREHFQIGATSLVVESATFGQVMSAAPGRKIQFSLRYSF